MTEKIAQWLRGFPGLEALTEEWIGEFSGCAGLFAENRQTIERTTDILGTVFQRQRLRWTLVTKGTHPPQVDPDTAPVLGMLQQVSLGKKKLVRLDQTQIPQWETELTVEYTEAVPEKGERV